MALPGGVPAYAPIVFMRNFDGRNFTAPPSMAESLAESTEASTTGNAYTGSAGTPTGC